MGAGCKSFAINFRRQCLVTAAAFLSILASFPAQCAAPKLKALTTILPLYCFAANVVGTLADVENLLPGNVGPHDFQFSARDLQKISEADLIIVNGLGLEAWLDKPLQTLAKARKVALVEASEGLTAAELVNSSSQLAGISETQESHGRSSKYGGPNPHIWLDPRLAMHAVTNILRAFQLADAANASGYAENAGAYLRRLAQLDATIQIGLTPIQGVPFIAYHDAFAYWMRRYDLRLVGVVEAIPEVDPSPQQLHRLCGVIRQTGAKAIFTEPQFSSRLARQIARDLKLSIGELDPMETGPFTLTAYEDMMQANMHSLLRNLQ